MNKAFKSIHFNEMPGWFNGINRIWKYSYPIGTRIKLDKDNLIKTAKRETGLTDLGKDFCDEPLERLLKAMNEEARLHPIGYFISKKRLVNLLSTRLKAEWWFQMNPSILDQKLYPVTLISGLQRTGTTKLQRLLSADPDARSLLSWEALNPSPPIHGKDNRIKFAKTSEKVLKIMAPRFFTIHPVEHLSQEEDILLLDVSFLSTTPEATMHVPSYASWLEGIDQSPAYEYTVKLLKLLQWQSPGKRWVLKSPHHLEFLDLVKKYYGNVQFIWTHRKLTDCVPSFLSMMAHSQSIFSDHVDLGNITNHWLNKTSYMLEKAIQFRESEDNNELFIDNYYDDFLEDPIGKIRNIYERMDIWEPGLRTHFESIESKNIRGKYGAHNYSLEDFNLTDKNIQNNYRHYISIFNTNNQEDLI